MRDEVLISFDVISLFTKIPIDLALEVARERLENDTTLDDRTILSVDDILSLLSLCLNATYFSFRGTFYKQVFGTAMGSPVSVVVANLVMEHIEDKALSSFPSPTFWKRYIDDVCTAVNHAEIIPFLQHLNSIHPSIQFTHERENDKQCLSFLDVLLERCDDGSLSTSVYWKPTHTGRYLDFASHHPPMHKKAVVKTLFSRAKSLSSCAKLHEECCHSTEVLSANHYPRKFIDRAYRAHPRPKPSDDSSFKKTVLIPYIRGLSEAIQRFLAEVNIRVVFRPLSTLQLSRNTSGRRSIKWTSRKLVFLPMNQTFTNAASWNLGTFRSSTPSIGNRVFGASLQQPILNLLFLCAFYCLYHYLTTLVCVLLFCIPSSLAYHFLHSMFPRV